MISDGQKLPTPFMRTRITKPEIIMMLTPSPTPVSQMNTSPELNNFFMRENFDPCIEL